ncbi:MAG: DUF4388 domain-containing protein [Candidatus Obscuribacterales bacterium]|nr:DUF4388 domain-containing protein [Candidatus Obscuribacterales bacterium]
MFNQHNASEKLPPQAQPTMAPIDGSTNPSAPAFRTYAYRENLFAELERLVKEERRFDGLTIDLMQTDFSLPLDIMVKFHAYGQKLLKPEGILLFIKADAAVTLTKDDPGGGLTFNVYDSPFAIFARHPILADYVCATVTGIDRRRMRGGGSTLANHILFSSIPVLSPKGSRLKSAISLSPPQTWLLHFIDDYASIESISSTMETQHNIHPDETLRLLQELETDGIIYPLFARIHFLANCYHNHKPFRLGRYMVASGIISSQQLEELLETQEQEGWGRNQKTFLGLLAVRKGYLNTRELEVLLHDQYFYGGYQKTEATTGMSSKGLPIETMKNSMIGSLGAIDSAGLLQSISTAKKTGILTVENRDNSLIVSFQDGKATHARLGLLKGYNALVEFMVNWLEGIFVFKDKSSSTDLDNECLLRDPLDRIMLDSALFQDQTAEILAKLPGQRNVILERASDFDSRWNQISNSELRFCDQTKASDEDKSRIPRLAYLIDGLTTLDEVITAIPDYPSHKILKCVQFLVDHELAGIQQTSLFKPLTIFQRLSAELQETLGASKNRALLETSLHYVHGDSEAAQRFNIDKEGRLSINLSRVKASSTPVSIVLLELRRWMEAYLAHARRQLDPQTVDNIITRLVQNNST